MKKNSLILFLFIFFINTSCSKKVAIDRDGPGNIEKIIHYEVTPKKEKRSKYGNPKTYKVFGKTYKLLESHQNYEEIGIASWYGKKFHGRLTSTREPFDMYKITAAHKTLPIPCYVNVENLENGKKIIVRVNDRGPFADNRIIDLSFAAASVLGFVNKGTAKVRVTSYIFKDEKVNNHAFEGIIEDDTISKFYIQLAAFKDLSGAKVFKNKLSKININTSISFDDMFYRIQIGPLKNDELSEAISILEINNLSDFIVIKN